MSVLRNLGNVGFTSPIGLYCEGTPKRSHAVPSSVWCDLASGQLGIPERPQRGSLLWPTSWVNDGGDDAPLSPHGRVIFRAVLLGIFVMFVVLVLLTASGH